MKNHLIVFLISLIFSVSAYGKVGSKTNSTGNSVLLVTGYAEMGWVEIHLDAIRDRHHRIVYALKNNHLKEFQTIILTRNFNSKNFDWSLVNAFFKRGGELVVVGDALPAVLKNLPGVFGGEVRRLRITNKDAATNYEYAKNRLFTKKIKNHLNGLKLRTALTGLDGGENLIWKNSSVYAWQKKIGNGKLLYLPKEILLPSWPKNFYKLKSPFFTKKNKNVKSYSDYAFNILLNYLGVVKLSKKIAVFVNKSAIIWNRSMDDSIYLFEGAMSLVPPYPKNNSEKISSVKIETGPTGYTRKMFFLNLPRTVENVTFHFSNLVSAEKTISKKNIRLGIQGKLDPEYRGPYVYVNWLENDATRFALSTVSTMWLEVRAEGALPGNYRGNVTLRIAGGKLAKIPISVTVRDVPPPSPNSFKFCLEFSVHDLRRVPIDSWLNQWERLGVSFLNAGNSAWDQYDPIIRATGERLSEFAEKSGTPLNDKLPELDFSLETLGRFDLLLQKAVARNISTYRTYYFNGQFRKNFVMLAKKLYRNDKINVDSPEVGLTAAAVMRQLGVFLREKGMLEYYSKSLDEWHAKALPSYLSVAKYVHQAGWGNIGNPDVSVLGNKYLRKRIWKYIQIYWMEVHPKFWADLKSHTNPPVSTMPCGYFSFATSSYWWNNSYMDGYEIMWASAFNGDAGFHMHGWARGKTYAGVYFLDGLKKPCPSMGLLMYAEAISDVRYVKMLQNMLLKLKKHNPVAFKRYHSQWRKVLNNSPDAFLPVVNGRISSKSLSSESFRIAKTTTFDLIEKIMEDMRKIEIEPTLKWSDTQIVTKGKRAISILYVDSLRKEALSLQQYVKSSTGVSLKLKKFNFSIIQNINTKNAIVICDISRKNARLKLGAMLNGVITECYPHAGSYVFHEDKLNNTLWIIGDSADCMKTAIMNLSKTMKLHPYWYKPEDYK